MNEAATTPPHTNDAIAVLIVDDSAVARMHLKEILETDPRIEVIGAVTGGIAAIDFLDRRAPDLIVMDVLMPDMDGFEATRRIMESKPVPIVLCTALSQANQVALTFRSLGAGAVACVAKPVGREHPDFVTMADELRQTVRLMAEVKVIRRWPRRPSHPPSPISSPPIERDSTRSDIEMIGIGASTGGPPVLQTILSGLAKNFPVPILAVQHISRGFLPGLVKWLNQTTQYQVHIAEHGVIPLPGHLYLAPDDHHLTISSGRRIALTSDGLENGLRPSVAALFRSLAVVCGPHAVGILLTGMGRDGAVELKQMKEAGALTIAQDRESSVVHGMPGEVIAIGGASRVLPAERISFFLNHLVESRSQEGSPP